ncbi:MAG: NFACT family protein, partial [Erysipelotrichales bacterium]|nr:NFACT family protein [Erysipelotrichales bacterium]
MSCDGLLLHRIHEEIKQFLPAKINKLYCISDTELLLHCRGRHENFKILISAHSQYARMNITTRSYPTPETPSNFTMLLRKHCEGGVILDLHQVGLDRVFYFDVQVRNEIGDLVVSRLYVELMGKYANIILCDEKGKIIDAMKRIPPFENTKRIIVPTAMYTPVEVQDKKDPLGENIQIDDLTPLYKQFHGFSPLLSREFEYRIHNGEKFEDIMHELMSTDRMYFYDLGDNFEYHCLPLLHLDQKAVEYDLMEGFDILYYHKEEKERIRQQTGDLFRFVSKELNKLRSKLLKLRDTLEEAENCEKYRIYGELLYAYGYSIEKGAKKALLPSFEDGELIEIPLDPKFDVKYNAKKMYQKYNKGKNAQVIVAEQIELCKSEIAYFELLQT